MTLQVSKLKIDA